MKRNEMGTSIPAGLSWCRIYADGHKKRAIPAGMCMGEACMGLLSMYTDEFFIYAFIYSGMYFFQKPVHGLSDAFYIKHDKKFL